MANRLPTYDVAQLEEMPTLCVSQADNLKIDTGDERVWLCRCTRDDGMCCDAHVTVERLHDGRWATAYEECH
jgi:hypothetical protein